MHFTLALPRLARNERGEGWGEGKSNKTKLLSPTLTSSFVGREGENPFRFIPRFPYFNSSGAGVRASVPLTFLSPSNTLAQAGRIGAFRKANCNAIHKSLLLLRKFSSSPHDEGVGRGPRRGAMQRNQRPSSPQPSPPSDGGEELLWLRFHRVASIRGCFRVFSAVTRGFGQPRYNVSKASREKAGFQFHFGVK